jgi:hypothetical protein
MVQVTPIGRFAITSHTHDAAGACHLCENNYCARGKMEERIKDCRGNVFADRTLSGTMRLTLLSSARARR